jgi:hypothetical protein
VRSIRSASVSAPTAIGCASPCGQRAAPVAKPFLADLLDAPQRGRLRLVVVGDVGEARPVEAAGIGDAARERVAVTADVLRQRVDHEPGVHRLRPEQRRRRHRVVDDVQDAARLRELADPREVGDLRSRVRNRLDEDEPRRRL